MLSEMKSHVYMYLDRYIYIYFNSLPNQSVESAGVVFVKGANERNEFFEKVNSKT